MSLQKARAREAAIGWWAANPDVRNAVCDGPGCACPLATEAGYLCKTRTFGSADLVCEACFDKVGVYEPWTGNPSSVPADPLRDFLSAVRFFGEKVATGTMDYETAVFNLLARFNRSDAEVREMIRRSRTTAPVDP